MGKTVIFDMDGVIFDTERLVLSTWKQVAKDNDVIDIDKIFYKCLGTNRDATREILLDYYGRQFPYDEFRIKASKLFHEYISINGIPVKAGVFDIMEYLSENGYKIGIASSTRTVIVREELESVDLLRYFDKVIGGDMVSKSKPNPEIFLKCGEELGDAPDNIYVIEDSYNGVRAGYLAGMKTIMVPDLVEPTKEIQELCVAVFEDLFRVIDFFKHQK